MPRSYLRNLLKCIFPAVIQRVTLCFMFCPCQLLDPWPFPACSTCGQPSSDHTRMPLILWHWREVQNLQTQNSIYKRSPVHSIATLRGQSTLYLAVVSLWTYSEAFSLEKFSAYFHFISIGACVSFTLTPINSSTGGSSVSSGGF